MYIQWHTEQAVPGLLSERVTAQGQWGEKMGDQCGSDRFRSLFLLVASESLLTLKHTRAPSLSSLHFPISSAPEISPRIMPYITNPENISLSSEHLFKAF